jgi:3-mercaptopyruvate sulfurtransferase SseA
MRHGCLCKVWRSVFLLVISAGFAIAAASLHPQHEHFSAAHWQVRELTVSDLSLLSDRLVVDARSRELYDKEHVPGAVWLVEEAWDVTLPGFLMEWQPNRAVVIYCGGGVCAASKRVALRLLKDLPEMRIYVLKGGFPAWQAYQSRNTTMQ